MNKRFLIKCDQCGMSRRIRRSNVHNEPTFDAPASWIQVGDDFVCSFNCAKNRSRKLENKSLFQHFLEKMYEAATLVPGVK